MLGLALIGVVRLDYGASNNTVRHQWDLGCLVDRKGQFFLIHSQKPLILGCKRMRKQFVQKFHNTTEERVMHLVWTIGALSAVALQLRRSFSNRSPNIFPGERNHSYIVARPSGYYFWCSEKVDFWQLFGDSSQQIDGDTNFFLRPFRVNFIVRPENWEQIKSLEDLIPHFSRVRVHVGAVLSFNGRKGWAGSSLWCASGSLR